jgi:hypothetical protein
MAKTDSVGEFEKTWRSGHVYDVRKPKRSRHAPGNAHTPGVEVWAPRLTQQSRSWPCVSPPRHHEIDNHGRDDQHDPEEARVAKPSHGISPCTTLSPVPSSSVSMSYYTNAGGATRHRLERSSGLSPHIQVIRVEGQRVPVGEEHKASRLPAVVHDYVRGREKKGDDEGEVQKSYSASRVSGQSSGSLGGIERNALALWISL